MSRSHAVQTKQLQLGQKLANFFKTGLFVEFQHTSVHRRACTLPTPEMPVAVLCCCTSSPLADPSRAAAAAAVAAVLEDGARATSALKVATWLPNSSCELVSSMPRKVAGKATPADSLVLI